MDRNNSFINCTDSCHNRHSYIWISMANSQIHNRDSRTHYSCRNYHNRLDEIVPANHCQKNDTPLFRNGIVLDDFTSYLVVILENGKKHMDKSNNFFSPPLSFIKELAFVMIECFFLTHKCYFKW